MGVHSRRATWRVQKRSRGWEIVDCRGRTAACHDVADSLVEAHTYAMQLAVSDELFAPGGLTRLRDLLEISAAFDWWVDEE